MIKYIVRRLLSMIPVLLGISFILFMIMSYTPGNPAVLILGDSASKQDVQALMEDMGLNDPVIVQYFSYMKNVFLHGDFGNSYISKLPVTEELAARLPITVTIAVGAMIVMVVISIPIGIFSAVRQYSILDNATMLMAMILCSMPSFFFGLVAMLIFALRLGWLPSLGAGSFKHFILPWFTCSSVYLAQLIRMTRSNMLEVIRADYIRTARSKGAPERSVIFRHALRNALLPVITILGINFGAMCGGAVMTESVFSLAGVGTMIVSGIRKRDTPTVMIAILFVAVMISVINLLVDIVNTYIDPRLRSSLR